jgi:hypothetical protein
MSNRQADWENMKREKRAYHKRLRRVIDGLAWFNGHDLPTDADYDEAQHILRDEYLAICRW